jgi:hypothetical protein
MPSFVGSGFESGELAPDATGFALCAAEPSFEDCPLVGFLALRGEAGAKTARSSGVSMACHWAPSKSGSPRPHCWLIWMLVDAGHRSHHPGMRRAIVSACEPGSGFGWNSRSDTP